ncbi:O-methyltransferase [Robiginitalea sediminis]|uniref:O-methyltransferase n=1 Tax=Robiginitalea sediminis TaxID=1982593 RepID=UPI000B4B0184|nr:O-methyltransferase [Robiginitalea sediminis]
MHFLSAALESYIAQCSEAEPELLRELTRETHLKVLRPRMITGHYQGRVLSLISRLVRPTYILEVGTYTGYSALCLAEGMAPDGQLHTIDINPELTELQRRYFDSSPYGQAIIQHTRPALEVIPGLDLTFDLAFIDAEKKEYPEYFEAILPKMRKGGLILLDNVLWSGKVLDPIEKKDKVTPILKNLNESLPSDPRVRTVLLPIRDGLTVCTVE